MRELISAYNRKKQEIQKRLNEFKRPQNNKNLFQELCFCILTPQSKAVNCDKAIKELKKSKLLFKGSESDIKTLLKGLARFHNKKAAYIVAARNLFTNNGNIDVKNRLDRRDVLKTRGWLVKNVKGLGYKEASHFLRNIGLGGDMAILDIHVLRNLKELGIIEKIPQSLTKKNYMDIENRMRNFARKVDIMLKELDLLLWSNETGFVFK